MNGFEAWLERPGEGFALTSQRYTPDVIHPDGAERIEAFEPDPWPSWVFTLPDGSRIEHGLLVQPGRAATSSTGVSAEDGAARWQSARSSPAGTITR